MEKIDVWLGSVKTGECRLGTLGGEPVCDPCFSCADVRRGTLRTRTLIQYSINSLPYTLD